MASRKSYQCRPAFQRGVPCKMSVICPIVLLIREPFHAVCHSCTLGCLCKASCERLRISFSPQTVKHLPTRWMLLWYHLAITAQVSVGFPASNRSIFI